MIGGLGVLAGILTILLIKEPGRGVYDLADQYKTDDEKEDSLKKRQLDSLSA